MVRRVVGYWARNRARVRRSASATTRRQLRINSCWPTRGRRTRRSARFRRGSPELDPVRLLRDARIASSMAHWSSRCPHCLSSCALAKARSLSFHSHSSVSATRRLLGSTSINRRCAKSASIRARSTARRRSRSASSCRASISFRISSASSTAAGVILALISSPMASSTGEPAIDWQSGSPREPCARSQTYRASNLPRRAAYRTLRYLPQHPHTARPCSSAVPSLGGDARATSYPWPLVSSVLRFC